MSTSKKTLTALILTSLFASSCAVLAADLPSYYDWRLTDPTSRASSTNLSTDAIVSPIRYQGSHGTCWAFATIASLESTINLKLQAANLPPIQRLSERYETWLTYAKPLNGGGDGFILSTPQKDSLEAGGQTFTPISVLVRYGADYNSNWPYPDFGQPLEGVNIATVHGTVLHDLYGLITPSDSSILLKDNIDYCKTLIKDKGVVFIGYYSGTSTELGLTSDLNQNVYHSSGTPDHAVTLVGWDDNHTMTDTKGIVHKGAWLLRNSWGTKLSGQPVGENGYFYLSYDDTTAMMPGVLEAETDWGRYTAINTIAPAGMNFACEGGDLFNATTSYKTADKLTSGASQMLKAVGIYVPADDMSYKIEVSLKGTKPADTTPIYSQSGTFGQDGTAKYQGYRTIDFNKFIYLPNTQNYIITVTLTGKDGMTYKVPLAGAAYYDTTTTLASGVSFIYDAATGTWVDTLTQAGKDNFTKLAIPLYALIKYSNEANGGDFSVVSLNDNGVGGSEIYLGKKDELYTTDLLHPTDRYTLSNMTVELTKDLTDSWYGGVISGEGSVTKTGDGMLALSGANTYTGATNVNAGSLALTGSLQSPVTVASGATLIGTGTINGNLTSKGILVPGLNSEARTLMGNSNPMGTLTVNGNLNSTGALQIAVKGTENSALKVSGASGIIGTSLSLMDGYNQPLVNHHYTYLSADGGITGNATTASVSPYISLNSVIDGNNGILTATQTQTLGNLSGMTPSENSVGAALNKALLNHIANNPNAASTAEMNSLLYQDAAASQASIKQITNVTRAQLIAVSPLTAMTTGATYDRLDTALYDSNVNVAVPTASFDGVPATMQVAAPMTLDTTNNLWFKLLRGFESYGGTDGGYDLDNKSFGGVIGYDRAVNGTTRVGGLLSYAKTDYSTDVMSGDSHDWRIGIYASHDTGTWKTQGLISYGQNKYDFNRYIAYDNSKLSSDYTAKVFDMDLKVKYLPQYNRAKSWQVAPYVGLAYTHSTQGSYAEDGSSIFAQNIDSTSNNSYRAEVGVEWKHDMTKDSSFGGSVGYKRVLSGVNPELNGTFVGDNNRFTLKTDNDRNYFTYSLNLKKNTGHNWTVQGDVRGEKSAHNHSEVYSVMAKYAF